jgi:hypothetical protein
MYSEQIRCYVRSAVAWFVFIVAAFALPATTVRVHEGRLFRCQHNCFTPALSKWPSQLSKKNGLPSRSAVAKNQSASGKSQALAVTNAELSR